MEKSKLKRVVQDQMILDSPSRRKAVKTIVGGTAALAAYNVLPAKWGTPIIEQVFLPAHAQTSGSTITNLQLQIVNGDTTTEQRRCSYNWISCTCYQRNNC